MKSRPRWLVAAVVLLVAVPLLVAGIYLLRRQPSRAEKYVPPPPEAPPDLAKLRPAFLAGLDALQKKDGAGAVKHFGSFTFGTRAVEEYRLLFLARGHDLTQNPVAQRTTLASLWARDPKLAARDESGAILAGLYAGAGDFARAAVVSRSLATHADSSSTAAPARWQAIEASFASGDLAALLDTAQRLVIRNPEQRQAGDAVSVLRALEGSAPDEPIHLTPAERLERGLSLLRDGDPTAALEELTALSTVHMSAEQEQQVRLNRGIALSQLRQYEASNKLLEPLESGPYVVAIPALRYASNNYRALSVATNPFVIKTKIVRQKVGTVKVKVKGKKKLVTKPKYANVKKTTQLVDLAKKAKKEEYDRLTVERLKDLLTLTLPRDVRIDTLNPLIALAEAKNQDDYERDLITRLVKVDPAQDPGLQHFWDKAWAAYARGDWTGARDLLGFIMDTYRSANVRRQARYWYARAGERIGKATESKQMYEELANAPYEDVYVIYATARGAPRVVPTGNPLKQKRPDWTEIAEKRMPAELRLAYELTALSAARDARVEIQRNRNRTNGTYAEALLADLYNSSGDMMLMMRSLRHAYPQLGSVEQDSVPPYFLRMYHPTRYHEDIRKSTTKNALDPYLVMGLIHQESYFNPKARSSVGATGLMQLMPATGKELAQRLGISPNLENPETNIRLGTFHFRQLVNLFGGNTQLAVASYNAGQGNVAKWRRAAPNKPNDEFLESIPFPETRTYVKRVTVLASSYRRLDQ